MCLVIQPRLQSRAKCPELNGKLHANFYRNPGGQETLKTTEMGDFIHISHKLIRTFTTHLV